MLYILKTFCGVGVSNEKDWLVRTASASLPHILSTFTCIWNACVSFVYKSEDFIFASKHDKLQPMPVVGFSCNNQNHFVLSFIRNIMIAQLNRHILRNMPRIIADFGREGIGGVGSSACTMDLLVQRRMTRHILGWADIYTCEQTEKAETYNFWKP